MLDSSQPNGQGSLELIPNEYEYTITYDFVDQKDYEIATQEEIISQTGRNYCTQILIDYRVIKGIIDQLNRRRDELLAQNSELQMEVSSLESDIATKNNTINTQNQTITNQTNEIYDKDAILDQLPITINANKNGFYVASISDTPSSVPYTITYDNHEGTPLITTAATLYPFKILNQYNDGDIIRANGNYQVAFDNAPTTADSGYTLIDKALGCPINIHRFRINVPNGTEVLNATTNGTYTPTSPNIGFSSVNINVPTGAGISLKYISLVSGGSTTTGKSDFDFSSWTTVSSSTTVSLTSGYTFILYSYVNGSHNLKAIGYSGNNVSLTVAPPTKYKKLNYDIGDYVYLLDENLNNVLTCTVYYNISGGINTKRIGIELNENNFTLISN